MSDDFDSLPNSEARRAEEAAMMEQPQYETSDATPGDGRSNGKRSMRGPRAEAIFASGRTFGSFFGQALTSAGSLAAPICFVALISAGYQWHMLGDPSVRQLLPGLLLGVIMVVLVYSLWLWAYRHNGKGTTWGTFVAYSLFVVSLAILVGLWLLYPLLSIGVALAFAVSSLVVELAARKHGESEYKRGRQDAIVEMTLPFQQLQGSLALAERLASTVELAARASVQASERVNASSTEVATAASSTKAALARAEHIRDNLDAVVQQRAKELVPENVAKLEGEAAQRHAQELAEARESGRHESEGKLAELQLQIDGYRAMVPVLRALQEAHIIDKEGNILPPVQQPQQFVPGQGPVVQGGRL